MNDLRTRLLEILQLKELQRAGWTRARVDDPESVAAHSWGVAWLVLALCPPGVNRGRALALAVIHDLPEVRAGDITPYDGVDDQTKLREERAALAGLIAPFDNREALRSLWEEYAAGQSTEARFVKACDKLDMGLQALRYRQDTPELDLSEFLDSALARLEGSELALLLTDPASENKPLQSDD